MNKETTNAMTPITTAGKNPRKYQSTAKITTSAMPTLDLDMISLVKRINKRPALSPGSHVLLHERPRDNTGEGQVRWFPCGNRRTLRSRARKSMTGCGKLLYGS